MDSGRGYLAKKIGGTYSLNSINNARAVFKVRCSNKKFDIGKSFLLQRDEKDEDGNQNYLWHHDNFWRLGDEDDFNKKNVNMFKTKSDGKKNHD